MQIVMIHYMKELVENESTDKKTNHERTEEKDPTSTRKIRKLSW